MKGLRLAAAILAVLMAFLLCSCGKDKETIDEQLYEEDLEPASSIVINEEEAEVLNEKVPVCLYFGDEQKSKLVKEIRYLDIDEAKKGVSTLASAIVKELISGPKAKGLTNVLPEGVTLRAPVTVEGRVATVDLTREFIDNHPGGKTMEELSVYSIVNALTELKEIERVKIIINGKQAKNFKGNLTLDKEFPEMKLLSTRKWVWQDRKTGGWCRFRPRSRIP